MSGVALRRVDSECRNHHADQNIRPRDAQGESLQVAALLSEGVGLFLAPDAFLGLSYFHEPTTEVCSVGYNQRDEYDQQGVLSIEHGIEAHNNAVEDGEEREQHKVDASHLGVVPPDDGTYPHPLGLAPLHLF